MPSLRKRKLKSGGTYWDIGYYVNGTRRYYSVGETDRRTATKVYHEFCSRLAEGKFDGTGFERLQKSVSSFQLSDLAKLAIDYATTNKSTKTGEREQLSMRNFVSVLGDIQVNELTPEVMETYKSARLKDVSAHTVNIEIRVFNTLVNQARSLGKMDPKEGHNFKQMRTPDTDPPKWLNTEQIDLLMSHNDPEFRRFLQFALQTGCRRNEILGIEWSDVDLPRRRIIVRGEVGKMGKRRVIPISDMLAETLIKWPGTKAGLLFPKYKSDSISQKFRRYARTLGLPEGISLHSLRSTFACHLRMQGVDIYTVSRLLGHSSVKVTEKHYLDVGDEEKVDVVNRLNFGNGEPSQ